jgi:hypothetical protein
MESAVCFPPVPNTIHDHPVADDLKKGSPIAGPHPVLGKVLRQPLNVTTQIVLKPTKTFHDALTISGRQRLQVSFSARFELDLVFHCERNWNDRTDRRGRPVALELETDAARPRSVQ